MTVGESNIVAADGDFLALESLSVRRLRGGARVESLERRRQMRIVASQLLWLSTRIKNTEPVKKLTRACTHATGTVRVARQKRINQQQLIVVILYEYQPRSRYRGATKKTSSCT